MVKNQQVGTRTKHIDVKYHFTKDMVEEGKLLVKYIPSEKNYADILTKNVSGKVFDELVPDLRNGKLKVITDSEL